MNSMYEQKKSRGCLKSFVVIVIIVAVAIGIFCAVKFSQDKRSQVVVDGNGTVQGNTDGEKHLFRRSANNGDIVVSSDLDLSNFGGKYVIMPQTDIDNLQVTINYLDKKKKILASKVKSLGNVKEGVQVNFSISLFDLGISVAWNTQYETVAVTGGTVSYFA